MHSHTAPSSVPTHVEASKGVNTMWFLLEMTCNDESFHKRGSVGLGTDGNSVINRSWVFVLEC